MGPTRDHSDAKIQGANDAVERMKQVQIETQYALQIAADDMKQYYNAKHRPEEFLVGDWVFIGAQDLTTERPSKKLDYKHLGPFRITHKIGNLAYRLQLPKSFKIHPVISVSRLERAKPDEWDRPRPRVTLKVTDLQTGHTFLPDPFRMKQLTLVQDYCIAAPRLFNWETGEKGHGVEPIRDHTLAGNGIGGHFAASQKYKDQFLSLVPNQDGWDHEGSNFDDPEELIYYQDFTKYWTKIKSPTDV